MNRIYYSLLLMVALLVLPWWLGLLAGLAGIFLFPYYLETVVLFFVYDLAYGLPHTGIWGSQFNLTILAVAVLTLAETYKHKIIFYNR